MTVVVASAPGKMILFGEHGVHRSVPNIVTSIGLRTYCRVAGRSDDRYSLRSGEHYTEVSRDQLAQIKAQVDALREAQALDDLTAIAREFFGPVRYVMASLLAQVEGPGLDVEWRSELPIGSGLGSGAAAFTAMARAAFHAFGHQPTPDEIIFIGWQGDVIAHGGYGSSLDSSAIVLGGLIDYSLEAKAKPLPFRVSLPVVLGDTLRGHSTAEINTHIRLWLHEQPARMHIFRDMAYLRSLFLPALEQVDLPALGHLMNLHQLLQEKMGTSCPESEALIEASIAAGALGAKISGSGRGGVMFALAEPGRESQVAAAIDAAGGRSYIVQTAVPGVRLEPVEAWASGAAQT